MATRRTQPYRQGARSPGTPLTAMLRGRTTGGLNPQDIMRASQRLAKVASRASRKPRRPRPPRAPR